MKLKFMFLIKCQAFVKKKKRKKPQRMAVLNKHAPYVHRSCKIAG